MGNRWKTLAVVFVSIFLVTLLIGSVSALGFSFVDKTYDEVEDKITIKNWFGLGATQGEYILTDNTYQCLTNCHAEGNTTLYNDAVLFSGVEFKNKFGNTKEINDYKWFIEIEDTKDIKIPTYTEVCFEDVNGTNCRQEQNGTRIEEIITHSWQGYFGEELIAGDYKWRLEGKKEIGESVDWIASAFGKTFDEWAWWDTDWTYYRRYNATEYYATAHTQEPIVFTINASLIWDKIQSDGDDLRIVNTSDNTELNRLITMNTSVGGNIEINFNLSVGASINTTQFDLYYGNAGVGAGTSMTPLWQSIPQSAITELVKNHYSDCDETTFAGSSDCTGLRDGQYDGNPGGAGFVLFLVNPGWAIIKFDADYMIGIANHSNFCPYPDGLNNNYLPKDFSYAGSTSSTMDKSVPWKWLQNITGDTTSGCDYRLTYLRPMLAREILMQVDDTQGGDTTGIEVAELEVYAVEPLNFSAFGGEELVNLIPIIGLINPINNFNSTSTILDFSCNATDDGYLKNITLVIDGIENVTNDTGFYSFDGVSAFVEVSDDPSLDITSAITISAWVNSRVVTGKNIITKFDNNADEAWQVLFSGSDKFDFGISDTAGFGDSTNLRSIQTILPNQWYHLLATYDGTEMRLYINGILDNNVTPSNGLRGNNQPVRIGADEDGSFLDGSIDEVRIYNSSLSPAEVTSLFNQGREETLGSVAIPNLVSYWDLGLNGIIDIRPTGNDGTNNGALPAIDLTATVGSFSEGLHNWSCISYDNTGQSTIATARNFTVDTTNPAVTIDFPTPTVGIYDSANNFTLNWTITDTNLNTCWFDYNFKNTTITCGLNTTNFTLTDQRNVTMWANDTSGNNGFDFVEWNIAVLQNSIDYNTTSYSSSSESFEINVTANSSLTAATLVYSGTTHEATQDGTNWTSTKTSRLIGSNSFYFSFTYGGLIYNSSTYSQNIEPIVFSICNTTYTTKYLNVSFKDEADGTYLNASNDLTDIDFWLDNSTDPKNYIYTNNTDNFNYTFCFYPPNRTVTLDLVFKYSKTGYPLRTFSYEDQALTNTTTETTLYLLATADGIYSSMNVIESSGAVIPGVILQVERQFGGVWVLLAQDITGSDGVATFWVNPNFQHRITASKTGYVNTQVTITPSLTLYTLTMSRTTGNTTYVSDIPGIKWTALPLIGSIEPGIRNFNVTVTSSESNLENCKFELVNASNLSQVFDSVTSITNSSYCFLNINYNALANTKFFGRLSLDTDTIDGFAIVNADWKWIVIDIDTKAWRSITSFFSDLKTLSEFGEGEKAEFSRIVTFFLLTTIIFGLFIYFSGVELTSPGITIFLIWGITLFASAGGFLTFNSGSSNLNSSVEQYGFFFIFTIYMLNYFLTIIRRSGYVQ